MTKVDVEAQAEGIGGGKIKVISSFPIVVKECETVIDKITTRRQIIYADHHGEKNGDTSITIRKIRKSWL